MADSSMSIGAYGSPYENGILGGGPGSLPSLVTNQPPGMQSNGNGMASPSDAVSAGGTIRRAAPEPNKRALYVGGLDQRVTEDVLQQIFATAGAVKSVKIIPDKNFQSKGLNYGFIEYMESESAEKAMQTLNGRRILQNEIRVNWAYQSNNTSKEDTSQHFHIFVGDLSNEVNDEVLLQAFGSYGTVSEARVMWDMKTGRSRGYGFVAFRDRMEADRALTGMNGEFLGSRAIRCNWANQKGQPSVAQQQVMSQMGMNPVQQAFPAQQQQPQQQQQQQQIYSAPNAPSYAAVLQQTPQHMTTVYVGNLSPYTTQSELLPLFQTYGYVQEVRLQTDRGYAFVKLDSHESAAGAIVALNNYNINGKPLKLGWGKDKNAPGNTQFDAFSPQNPVAGFSQSPGYFPQYGQQAMPAQNVGLPSQYQNANYGQYQHGAYSRTPATQYAGYPTQTYGYPQQGAYPSNGYQQ